MRIKRYIGDRAFYKRLFAIMLPMLVQNVITNFVSLLDNVMVGQVGTEPMSGVAIVNQLIFIFNLCIFGGLAGAGIFTAQYHGKGDSEGVRNTFRFKLYIGAGAVAVFLTLFLTAGDTLIGFFLHEGNEGLSLEATLNYGRAYLRIMLLQMAPFALQQVYVSTLRETGETVLPMRAGIIAVFVNLVLNYILIFGKLGAPALGVTGAAIATVIARFAELGIIMTRVHTAKEKYPFITGVYRSLRVPGALSAQIVRKGLPLLVNELLWSGGMTTLNQCYSTRGLEVVSAVNIASTVSNLFFCAFFAVGGAISIMVGQLLGAGETERAVREDRQLLAFAVALCAVVGGVMAVLAPLIPQVYNTTEGVKALACDMLYVVAALLPVHSFTNGCYFTLRSGGKTFITFLFDSVYVWTALVPLAFCLSRFTAMPILPMYAIITSMEIVKALIGYFMVKRKSWVNNLVAEA